MLIALLLLLLLVGVLVVALAPPASSENAEPIAREDVAPRVVSPPLLPPHDGAMSEPDPAPIDETADAGPSPTLTIPLGSGARGPNSYVLHLARTGEAWRVVALDPAASEIEEREPLDTLTLTVVVPWRDLERDYRWLKVVLR